MSQQCVEDERYGVDIRCYSTHAEVNALEEILTVLEGRSGQVVVIDRKTKSRVFQGSVDEVRSRLLHSNGHQK